jgi:hypothetical protein
MQYHPGTRGVDISPANGRRRLQQDYGAEEGHYLQVQAEGIHPKLSQPRAARSSERKGNFIAQ